MNNQNNNQKKQTQTKKQKSRKGIIEKRDPVCGFRFFFDIVNVDIDIDNFSIVVKNVDMFHVDKLTYFDNVVLTLSNCRFAKTLPSGAKFPQSDIDIVKLLKDEIWAAFSSVKGSYTLTYGEFTRGDKIIYDKSRGWILE